MWQTCCVPHATPGAKSPMMFTKNFNMAPLLRGLRNNV